MYVPTLLATSPFGGDAVGPDDDRVHLAGRHQRPGERVGDQAERDAQPQQLPGRETRPLEHRACLVDPDGRRPAGLVSRADHAERRAVPDAGERAGVAVREHAGAVPEEGRSMRAEPPVALHIFGGDVPRLRPRVVARERTPNAPGEVDRGRARRLQPGSRLVERLPGRGGKRDAHRPGGAERRRAADGERADRLAQLLDRAALELDELVRQPALVDQAHDTVAQLDRRRDRLRHVLTASRVARMASSGPPGCS